MLTPNQAVTIANIGELLGVFTLFLSGALLWLSKGNIRLSRSRSVVLGISYFLAIVVSVSVVALTISGQFPIFFISGKGSTLVRNEVLALTTVLLVSSCILFG